MVYQNFAHAQSFLLWSAFGIALLMGAVVNKTNFCTMGAVSDWVNMGDTGRMRAWLLAIAVALLGVALLEANGLVKPDASFPPYRAAQLLWAENLLGGLMFGAGMTLASGCGNKCLVRIGGGNIKAVMVLTVIALIAYFMVNPFPNTDKTLMSVLFLDWLRPLAVTLQTNQDLGSMLAGNAKAASARTAIGLVLGLGLAGIAFKSAEFRGNRDHILGGVAVGLAVLAAWYVSSNVAVSADGQSYGLQNFVAEQWDMFAGPTDVKPVDSRPLSAQSFTFINPMGQAFGFALAGFKSTTLTFGIMAVFGVTLGSFLWSLASRSFRIEWFASWGDFANHLAGAVLMGFGGVLAMGCTIGQGVTGLSTLAAGSFIAFAAIVAGSAATMKFQYWRMMREG